MKTVTRIRLIILTLIVAMFSCAGDMAVVNKIIDPETEPDLTVENLETFYSDSACLQLRMAAPLFKQFSSAKEPRDEYPNGLYVWMYEKTGEQKAEIRANWAKHNTADDLWEAQGNVVITSSDGRIMETEQFFWDRKKAIIYNEKYTKITDAEGNVTTGVRFTANQDFTNLRLYDGGKTGGSTLMLKDEVKDEN